MLLAREELRNRVEQGAVPYSKLDTCVPALLLKLDMGTATAVFQPDIASPP